MIGNPGINQIALHCLSRRNEHESKQDADMREISGKAPYPLLARRALICREEVNIQCQSFPPRDNYVIVDAWNQGREGDSFAGHLVR